MKSSRSSHTPASFEPLEPRALLAFSFADPIVPSAPQLSFEVRTLPDRVVSADFDGDAIPDLAVAEGKRIGFLKGNADGTFQDPNYKVIGTRVGRLAVAQDADGTPVLFSLGGIGPRNTPDTEATIFRSAMLRRFLFDDQRDRFKKDAQRHIVRPNFNGDIIRPIHAAELTGDALADAVIDFGPITLVRSRPNGAMVVTRVFNPQPSAVTTTVSLADINNDGRNDVILQSTRASGATQPQPIAYLSVNSNPSGLARGAVTLNLEAARDWRFADVNNDSRTDAVTIIRTSAEPTSTSVPNTATFIVLAALGVSSGAVGGNFFLAPVEAGSFSTLAGNIPLTITNLSAESLGESISFRLLPNLGGPANPGVGMLLQRRVEYTSRSGDDIETVSIHALPLISTTSPGTSTLAYSDRRSAAISTPSNSGPRLSSPIDDFNTDGIPDAIRIRADGTILTFLGVILP